MTPIRTSRIGARRIRLTIEAPVETPDALGGASFAFAPVSAVWGEILATGGRETGEAGRLQGASTARITIPFREGLDTRMRFRSGARLFGIDAVFDPDGRRRVLACLTREVTP